MIALECKSRIDAINAGKNPDIPNKLWEEFRPCFIMEVKPNGSFGGDIVDHVGQSFWMKAAFRCADAVDFQALDLV